MTLKAFLAGLPDAERHVDLFVVTHIDADHISGAIAVARDETLKSVVRSVWFNGAGHLSAQRGNVRLSVAQGDHFSRLIVENGWGWNEALKGEAICRREGQSAFTMARNPEVKVTVLGPTPAGLAALQKIWRLELADEPARKGVVAMGSGGAPDVATLAASPFAADSAIPNGSSIAFLLEFAGRRILLSADSHASTLVEAIDDLFSGRLQVDVATVPHHGSKHNTSRDLADRISSVAWTVSTERNEKHRFPHGESIARLLTTSARENDLKLVFNSAHRESAAWNDAGTKARYRYSTSYPTDDRPWVTIEL